MTRRLSNWDPFWLSLFYARKESRKRPPLSLLHCWFLSGVEEGGITRHVTRTLEGRPLHHSQFVISLSPPYHILKYDMNGKFPIIIFVIFSIPIPINHSFCKTYSTGYIVSIRGRKYWMTSISLRLEQKHIYYQNCIERQPSWLSLMLGIFRPPWSRYHFERLYASWRRLIFRSSLVSNRLSVKFCCLFPKTSFPWLNILWKIKICS